jgi:hypothetical protein
VFRVFSQSFEEKVLCNIFRKNFPNIEKIEIQLTSKFFTDDKIEIDYTRNINLGRGIAFVPVIATKGKKTSASIVSVKVQCSKNF